MFQPFQAGLNVSWDLGAGWEEEGRKPSVRVSGKEIDVPMTIARALWCPKLSGD